MTKRRLFLLIIIVFIMLGVLATIFFTQKHNTHHKTGLIITNATTIGSINQKDLANIETTIFQKIVASNNNRDSYYEATIRRNSLQVTYDVISGIRTPTYFFLVDIPAAKQTYQVNSSGGAGYPISILYVLCPMPSQLIYQPFSCQDEGV